MTVAIDELVKSGDLNIENNKDLMNDKVSMR